MGVVRTRGSRNGRMPTFNTDGSQDSHEPVHRFVEATPARIPAGRCRNSYFGQELCPTAVGQGRLDASRTHGLFLLRRRALQEFRDRKGLEVQMRSYS